MERLDAHDIEKFLVGLGSLLPSEAVRALVEEVRRQRLDGLRFDALMLSRTQPPSFAGVVRPSHMAVLRRCWHAKFGRSGRPPSHASAASLRQSHSAHPVPSEASAASSSKRVVEELPRSRSASRPRTVAEASKKRFTPPPRNSSHTNLSGLTATTAAGSSEAGCSTTTSKGKCPSESSSAAFPPSEKLAPSRHQSMKTSQEVHGTPASGSKAALGSKYGRTRSAGDIDPPLMGNRKPQKFRRPPQVPPLDFSFLYKGKEAEQKRREAQQQALAHKAAVAQASKASSEAPTAATSMAASSTALVAAHGNGNGNGNNGNGLASSSLPPGFAAASSEDQRRIAAFYGYREDGFIATMHGLRTDEIRPRLYLGTMADAAYWPLLKALGVTHILNCAVEAQKTRSPYEPHGIRYMLLPLHDSPETAQLLCKQRFRALREATRFIQTCIKTKNQRQGIFVHCVQGLSRSAAIVAAYLMEYEGLPMDRAIQEVRSRHKGCLTSHHWQAMLCKFNTDLLAQS